MTPSARDWVVGLRAFAENYRQSKPLADTRSAGRLEAAQRAILAAHLRTWIDGASAELSPTHGIALTTSEIGIAVADEMCGAGDPVAESLRHRLATVREIEYRLWTKDHPDPDHLLHVNHWSWIKTPVPRQRWHEFREFALRDGEQYWLHRTGTAGPGPVTARYAHLWKWTGTQAVLLKPFVREGVDAL